MALALRTPGGPPAPSSAPPSYAGGGGSSNNPYAVNFGNIPFAPSQFPSDMASLGPAYQNNYSNALNFNKALGGTVNDLYGTTMQQQLAGQQGIQNTIANYGAGARQNITDTNARNLGASQQSLISRGLGNFTVQDSAARGINYDTQKANLQLDDQIAAMKAGYQNTAIGQNTALAGNQANFLERMTGQYPNAGLYGQLAQQYGAAGQSAKNQQQYQDYLDKLRNAGAQGGGYMGGIGGGGGAAPQRPFAPGSGGGSTTPGSGGFQYQPQAAPPPVGVGAGAYTNDQFQQDMFDASYDPYGKTYDSYPAVAGKDEATGYPGSGDAFMAATGFPSGLGSDGGAYGGGGDWGSYAQPAIGISDPYGFSDGGWGG